MWPWLETGSSLSAVVASLKLSSRGKERLISQITALTFLPVQASGYGSGDDTYEDMEGRDEVKKVVEEREYTVVCTVQTLTHTHTHRLSAELLLLSVAGLEL